MKDAEKQPYIGIGTPIVNYHMTHRIFADGTVLEIMDHKILDSVAMGYYGGIQYQQKANTFGGGVCTVISLERKTCRFLIRLV